MLRHVADLRGHVLEELSTKVSWPLYKKYGHAFDAFKLTLQDEEDVFVGLDIDEETKQAMITHIKRRLAPQPSKVGRGSSSEMLGSLDVVIIVRKCVCTAWAPCFVTFVLGSCHETSTLLLDTRTVLSLLFVRVFVYYNAGAEGMTTMSFQLLSCVGGTSVVLHHRASSRAVSAISAEVSFRCRPAVTASHLPTSSATVHHSSLLSFRAHTVIVDSL